MIIFPKAKINIGLRIIEKRSDGYHNIETVFYPVELRDVIEFIVPSEKLKEDQLTVTGVNTGCLTTENILIKATNRFRSSFPIPYLKIHLHKVIPVGAGLGGGSSDAANLLKCLNRYFNAGMDNEMLKVIAAGLGSDCPFFIDSTPSIAKGRGEIMRPISLNLRGYHILLLNPGIHVSTGDAYEKSIPKKPVNDLEDLVLLQLTEWKDVITNDFEDTVFKKYPVIKEFKDELYRLGAIYSSMSGSGSAVYGLFNTPPVITDKMKMNVIFSGLL